MGYGSWPKFPPRCWGTLCQGGLGSRGRIWKFSPGIHGREAGATAPQELVWRKTHPFLPLQPPLQKSDGLFQQRP